MSNETAAKNIYLRAIRLQEKLDRDSDFTELNRLIYSLLAQHLDLLLIFYAQKKFAKWDNEKAALTIRLHEHLISSHQASLRLPLGILKRDEPDLAEKIKDKVQPQRQW